MNNADFTTTFSTGEYLVVRDDHKGLTTSVPIIRLAPARGTKDDLDTAIHEALHAEFPDLTEARVIRAADSITTFLWKLDYRLRVRKEKK